MEHLKWPSIENSYREKFIAEFLAEFPDLATMQFVITEKAHGSSVQLAVDVDGTTHTGTRRRWLPRGEKFYNLWSVLDRPMYQNILRAISWEAGSRGCSIRLYGELYGGNVQKGVDYGPIQKIRFFGLAINDVFAPLYELERFAQDLYTIVPLVPVVGKVLGLEAALNFDANFITYCGPRDEGNICEGVVISPYKRWLVDHWGRSFLLKAKNAAFREKQAEKKPPTLPDTEVARLNAEFLAYITEPRLQAVFSKNGPIREPSQIGRFIRLMIADAKEEFLKDFGEEVAALEGKKTRKVYNVGRVVAEMLKETL